MENKQIAKGFWDRDTYPEYYGNMKQRRFHEIQWLVPRLEGKSIMDIGCGDGSLLNCLQHLAELDCRGCDFSDKLMKHAHFPTFHFDCYNPTDLPATDMTVIGAVIQYLFEDEAVERLLDKVNSPLLFLRGSCSVGEEPEQASGHSETLGEQYASYYRTIPQTLKLLNKRFVVDEITRVYPDAIESPFGTRQFYFRARRK